MMMATEGRRGVHPGSARQGDASRYSLAAGVPLKRPSITSRSTGTPAAAHSESNSELAYGIGCGISETTAGFWVISLKSGGPAEAAGIMKGDIVLAVDGKQPSSLGSLRRMLLGPRSTKVLVGVRRGNGQVTTVEVMRGGGILPQVPLLSIGMGFKHATSSGSFVVNQVQPGGPAERAGLLVGDLICMYNGENLAGKPNEYLTEMLSNNNDPVVRFGVRRNLAPTLLSVVVVRTPLSLQDKPALQQVQGLKNATHAPNVSDAQRPSAQMERLAFSDSQDTRKTTATQQAPSFSVLRMLGFRPGAGAREEDVRSADAVGPGLGSGAGTYSMGEHLQGDIVGGLRTHREKLQGYSSTYDSENSDHYISASDTGSRGRYSNGARVGSLHSDDSRGDESSSGDESIHALHSPKPYVRGRVASADSSSADESPKFRHPPYISRRPSEGVPKSPTRPVRRSGLKGEGDENEMPKDPTFASAGEGNKDVMNQIQDLREQVEGIHSRLAKISQQTCGAFADGAATTAQTEAESRRREAEAPGINAEMELKNSSLALESLKRQLSEMHAAEELRTKSDFQHQQLMEEMKSFLDAAKTLESERQEMENERQIREAARDEKITELKAEMLRFRDEHDGMLEGFDEVKSHVRAAMDGFQEKLKSSEHALYLEFNRVRSQIFEVITKHETEHKGSTPVVISNSKPATVIERAGQLIAIDSPRSSPDSIMASSSGERLSPRTHKQSRCRSSAAESSSTEDCHVALSPLAPRLQLRRCTSAGEAPEYLRCDPVILGSRIFFFSKSLDGAYDLQFAMVLDVASLNLRAVRVMGSLPTRCHCKFVVVAECLCIIPCDTKGLGDLKQIFVLNSAEQDRVYSQGCYVEADVPSSAYLRTEVVGRSCVIFCHDGDGNVDLARTCVLDTEMLSLRTVGNMLAPPPSEISGDSMSKCAIAVVGFKILLFLQDAEECWILDKAWLVDFNLGMARRQIDFEKGFVPPNSEADSMVVGQNVYIFPKDFSGCYDFDSVVVVDTSACTMSRVSFEAGKMPEENTRANILVLKRTKGMACSSKTDGECLLLIPELDGRTDFEQTRLIDPGSNVLAPSVDIVKLEVRDLDLSEEMCYQVVGERVYVLPGNRAANNLAAKRIAVLNPFEERCQTFAADFLVSRNAGFDVERVGSHLVFVPYDSRHRRSVQDVSLLDCSLEQT